MTTNDNAGNPAGAQKWPSADLDLPRTFHHFILMMKMVRASVCILSVVLCAAAAEQGAGKDFIRYLAGIELLKTAAPLTDAQKAAQYRALARCTNVTATEAVAFVKSYRNRAEAWQKVWAKVLKAAGDPALIAPAPAGTARVQGPAKVQTGTNRDQTHR